MMRILPILLATACGGGGGGTLVATVQTADGPVDFSAPCAFSDRTDDYGFHSIAGTWGFEAIWSPAAINAPGAFELDTLGGIAFFIEFPDPDDPGSPTFDDAEGTITFSTLDPEGGLVAGTFDVFVADPSLQATGTFECTD